MNPASRRRAELKNCATSEISAEHRRSVNVTGAVRLQIGIGVFAFIFFTAKDNVRRCCGGCGQREDKNRTCCNGSDLETSGGFHGDYSNWRRSQSQEHLDYIRSSQPVACLLSLPGRAGEDSRSRRRSEFE